MIECIYLYKNIDLHSTNMHSHTYTYINIIYYVTTQIYIAILYYKKYMLTELNIALGI